jgi:TonB family protein
VIDFVWNQIERKTRLQRQGLQLRSLIGSAFSSYHRLLWPGAISVLLHLFLLTFLILALNQIHTKGESVVYRITLQTLPPRDVSTFKTTPLPIRANPQIRKEEYTLKESIKQMEVMFEKKDLHSDIQPPTQTIAPKIPSEEQKDPPRPQEKEQAPVPLPLGDASAPIKSLNIKMDDGLPVDFSLPHLGEVSGGTIPGSGSEGQPDQRIGRGGSGDGPALGRGGIGGAGRGPGIIGSGYGPGQGTLGWKVSGTGAGTGQQGSGGLGSEGSGTGSGTGQRDLGRGGFGNYRTRVSYPRHAENPKPVYPLEAREKGYKGEVLLRIEVLSDGRVGQIDIRKSSGYEILDQSALSAVKKWKFIPAQKGGVSIPAWVNLPIKFDLQ